MNTSFDIKSCAEHLGAEIVGIDLSQDIDDSVFNDIDQAFAEYGVVFFRNQNITPEHQVDFSKRFGALECFPLTQYSVEGFPEVLQVTNIQKDGVNIGLADAGVTWHSDMSWTAVPPRGSALYAVELPVKDGKILGGTLFASATAAYDALPDDMKARIAGLTAIHSYVGKHAHRTKQGEYNREAMTEEQQSKYPEVFHPIVRTHPMTGRKGLYVVKGECTGIVDMPDADAMPLLDELAEHTIRPEFQYSHDWQIGDFLMWDNCSLQHLAVRNYDLPLRRMMHRTQFAGSVTF